MEELRRKDADWLARTIAKDAAGNALAVFVCDRVLRPLIDRIDPQAMKQARQALGLPPVALEPDALVPESARAVPPPGGMLPNGRQLIAARLLAKKRPSWAGDIWLVLALTGHDGDHYVVWNFIPEPEDGDPRCYDGTYVGDFEQAVAEYQRRTSPPW